MKISPIPESIGMISGLNLDYCGTEICDAGHLYGPSVRHSYVIHVIRKGKGIYRFGGKEYELSANQAFLIPPGVEVVYAADREDPWEYMWIGFHGYTSDQVIQKIGFTKETPYVHLDDTEELAGIIHEMLEASQLTYSNFMIRLGGMYRFFGTLIEKSEMKKVERTKYEYPQGIYVKQAMMYMLSNYSEKIKIDALADQIGITRNYLAKSFQKELGVSPQAFLINLRMEKAAELCQVPACRLMRSRRRSDIRIRWHFQRNLKRATGSFLTVQKVKKAEKRDTYAKKRIVSFLPRFPKLS